MQNNKSNYGLNYLRALSCLGILVAHSFAYAEMNYEGMELGKTLNYVGRWGMLQYVAFFFLISGYFVTMQIHEMKYSVVSFLKKRFLGIYPMYWLIASICVLLNLCFFHNYCTTEGFWKSIFLLAGENNTACKDEWTLYVQVLFYLVASIFFDKKIKKAWPVCIAIGVIAIVIYNSLNQAIMIAVTYEFIIKSVPLAVILFGGCIYYFLKLFSYKDKNISIVSAVLSLIIFTILYEYVSVYGNIAFIGAYFVSILIIFYLFKNVRKIEHDKFLILISESSYEIYLLHPTILTILYKIFSNNGFEYSVGVHFLVLIITLSCSLLMSIMCRNIVLKLIK